MCVRGNNNKSLGSTGKCTRKFGEPGTSENMKKPKKDVHSVLLSWCLAVVPKYLRTQHLWELLALAGYSQFAFGKKDYSWQIPKTACAFLLAIVRQLIHRLRQPDSRVSTPCHGCPPHPRGILGFYNSYLDHTELMQELKDIKKIAFNKERIKNYSTMKSLETG